MDNFVGKHMGSNGDGQVFIPNISARSLLEFLALYGWHSRHHLQHIRIIMERGKITGFPVKLWEYATSVLPFGRYVQAIVQENA